jgi:hypothetical protein
MRKRNVKIILGTVAVSAVLGVAVAAAATSQSNWTSGQGAQMTNAAGTTGNVDRLHLRARDGTGPRHSQTQSAARQGLRARDGTGPRHQQGAAGTGNRADCPYRT